MTDFAIVQNVMIHMTNRKKFYQDRIVDHYKKQKKNKKKYKKECLIYLNNSESRIIKKRIVDQEIKPV